MIFRDRMEAGRLLATALQAHTVIDPIILGLPRGGVAVAAPIASALDAPLDVLVVRKIGAPGQSELAIGAVTARGTCVWNEPVLQALGVTIAEQSALAAKASTEAINREQRLRAARPPLVLRHRSAVLVDDGVATGMSMQAALVDAWRLQPRAVIVAAPVIPTDSYEHLCAHATLVVALTVPTGFNAVGQYYLDFAQVADDDVVALLTGGARTI